MTSISTLDAIRKKPIVGIVRNISFEDFREILPVYIDAGLTVIEVTMNTSDALQMIEYANSQFASSLITGAGTVCTSDELTMALGAGSRFVVTPITITDLIQRCMHSSIPIFPGAFTATEIYQAWKVGASMVKVFPTTSVGPAYIRDIKGPLHQVPLMPTGGVDLDTIGEFFRAGASAVGVGSKLFDMNLVTSKNWKGLHNHFSAFVNAIKDVT